MKQKSCRLQLDTLLSCRNRLRWWTFVLPSALTACIYLDISQAFLPSLPIPIPSSDEAHRRGDLHPGRNLSYVRPQAKRMALQLYDGHEHRLHLINRPLYGNVFKTGCRRLLHRAEGRA